VDKVNNFTSQLVGQLRAALKALSSKVDKEASKEGNAQLLAVSWCVYACACVHVCLVRCPGPGVPVWHATAVHSWTWRA